MKLFMRRKTTAPTGPSSPRSGTPGILRRGAGTCLLLIGLLQLPALAQESSEVSYSSESPSALVSEPLELVADVGQPTSFTVRQGATTCQKIDFEGFGNLRPIQRVAGAIPATFVGSWQSITDEDAGGNGDFANEPSPSTTSFFTVAGTNPINFDEPVQAVSIQYSAGPNSLPLLMTGWSGPNGTGNPVATASGSILGLGTAGAQCSGDPNGRFCGWAQLAIDAPGNFIQSITFPGAGLGSVGFDDLEFCTSGATGVCAEDATTLCLNEGRFQVRARWQVKSGDSGQANAVRLTPDTGYFWFFDAANIEAVIKVLNACPINGNFWAFAAGLTDVEVVLTVTDTETGAIRIYSNPQGTPFAPIQDTGAFDTCP